MKKANFIFFTIIFAFFIDSFANNNQISKEKKGQTIASLAKDALKSIQKVDKTLVGFGFKLPKKINITDQKLIKKFQSYLGSDSRCKSKYGSSNTVDSSCFKNIVFRCTSSSPFAYGTAKSKSRYFAAQAAVYFCVEYTIKVNPDVEPKCQLSGCSPW